MDGVNNTEVGGSPMSPEDRAGSVWDQFAADSGAPETPETPELPAVEDGDEAEEADELVDSPDAELPAHPESEPVSAPAEIAPETLALWQGEDKAGLQAALRKMSADDLENLVISLHEQRAANTSDQWTAAETRLKEIHGDDATVGGVLDAYDALLGLKRVKLEDGREFTEAISDPAEYHESITQVLGGIYDQSPQAFGSMLSVFMQQPAVQEDIWNRTLEVVGGSLQKLAGWSEQQVSDFMMGRIIGTQGGRLTEADQANLEWLRATVPDADKLPAMEQAYLSFGEKKREWWASDALTQEEAIQELREAADALAARRPPENPAEKQQSAAAEINTKADELLTGAIAEALGRVKAKPQFKQPQRQAQMEQMVKDRATIALRHEPAGQKIMAELKQAIQMRSKPHQQAALLKARRVIEQIEASVRQSHQAPAPLQARPVTGVQRGPAPVVASPLAQRDTRPAPRSETPEERAARIATRFYR